MAVKVAGMVKTATNVETVLISADVGESILIKGISVKDPNADYVTLITNKTTVGYFRVNGTLGNMLYCKDIEHNRDNLLNYLIKQGIFHPYPVAEGETFSVSGLSGSNNYVVVEYDIYDAGDIKSTDVNGSASTEYDYIALGQPESVVANGYNQLKNSVTPEEFPKFPFGAQVGGNNTVTIDGIVGTPITITTATGSNIQRTTRIKLVKDRTILFDNDKEGLPFYGQSENVATDGTYLGGVSEVFGNTDVDENYFKKFEDSLTFGGGEELDVYVGTETVSGSTTLQPSDLELGFVAHVKVG